jgi:hypothetical protein
MPLTRPITPEEDICMSVSTVISGLLNKYDSNVKQVMAGIFADTSLGLNLLIESSNMTFAEKAALRGDMINLARRAFRAKLNLINPVGEELERSD